MDFEELKQKFIEFIKNKKAVSLVKLGFYIVLIIVAVLYASSMNRVSKETKENNQVVTSNDPIENYKNKSSYKAIYKYRSNEYVYTNVNKELLKIGDNTYLISEGKLIDQLDSENEVPSFEYNFWYFTPSYITKLIISYGEENYVTTYSNGTTEKSYLVNLSDFLKTFKGITLDIDDEKLINNKNITILLYIKDNEVTAVDINLSSFYKLIDTSATEHVLKIVYE